MKIYVNGKLNEYKEAISIIALIESLSKSGGGIVVELNGRVITRKHWPTTFIRENDVLEIVQFIGGG